MKILNYKSQQGYIALISILIVGALVLAIGVGVSLRSIDETEMSLNEELSNRALALVNACAEYALFQLVNNLSYAGNETLTINDSDSCDILSIEGSGATDRIIKAEALVMGYKKKIKIGIAQIEPLEMIYWEEVDDF